MRLQIADFRYQAAERAILGAMVSGERRLGAWHSEAQYSDGPKAHREHWEAPG